VRRIRLAGALLALGLLGLGPAAWAGVQVSGAWARATLPGQTVAGVYMQLRSDAQARLVGAKSRASSQAEIHLMNNEGGVMRMRRVDSLDLPAGKTVTLEPSGYHLMLLDINRPLKVGEHVTVTLVIEAGGKRFELPVQAQVHALVDDANSHAHEK
jgi:periplasmic copper chaperone A